MIRLIGIGSHHGDDQAGWLVADALQQLCGTAIDVRKIAAPLNLLHWLEDVNQLHIVDACRTEPMESQTERQEAVETVLRWEWPLSEADRSFDLRMAGSHDFDVVSVLRVAERLGRLPAKVVIWGIEGSRFAAMDPLSDRLIASLPKSVRTIAAELDRTGRMNRRRSDGDELSRGNHKSANYEWNMDRRPDGLRNSADDA